MAGHTNTNHFALIILMFNMFITMAGVGIIIPIMPEYLATFGVAGQVLGFLIATFSLSQFLFSPIAGDLSDRHGRKNLIIFGLIVFGTTQLIFGLSPYLWLLFVARFFSGIGAAFLVPPMMAFVADITTLEERGRGMGFLGASMSFGFMIGPALGGFLSTISLQFPFYVATTAALTAAIISYFVLPNYKPTAGLQLDVPKKRENIFQQLKRSTKTSYFIMFIVMFVFSFGLANFQATIALYVDHKFNYSPAEISVILTVGGFVGVISQTLLINPLFKKYGEMKVVHVNLLLAAIAMISILAVNTFTMILLVATVFFTATSLLRPAVNTLVSKLAGPEQGFAAGMITAYMSLGNMIGPALAGILFDINITYPYYLGTFILLVCFCITLLWSKRGNALLQETENAIK